MGRISHPSYVLLSVINTTLVLSKKKKKMKLYFGLELTKGERERGNQLEVVLFY